MISENIKTLFLIAISLSISSRKKDDDVFTPTLPPITQTGANTFGCYINGMLLVPRDGVGYYGGNDDGILIYGSSSRLLTITTK